MKPFLVFCAALSLWTFGTSFGRGSDSLSVDLIMDGGFEATNKAVRIKYARALLTEVERVYAVIPTLSPDEEKWLQSEHARIRNLKDTDAEGWRHAVARFVERKEKRISYLQQAFRNLRTLLNGIIDVGEERSVAIHAWVMVGTGLTEDDITVHLAALERERLIKLPYTIFSSEVLMKSVGRDILKKIVFENVRNLELELTGKNKSR